MSKKMQTKKLTVCAMLSALGVVLLWLGSAVEVVDVSMAVVASLFCVFAVIEYGGAAPWLIFSVTGLLSLILLPQKTPAILYLLFFGYYPIIKERLEKKRRMIGWIAKEIVFNGALFLLLILSRFLLMGSETEPLWMFVAVVVLAEIAFPVYDMALTRLISFYLFRVRHRLRIK